VGFGEVLRSLRGRHFPQLPLGVDGNLRGFLCRQLHIVEDHDHLRGDALCSLLQTALIEFRGNDGLRMIFVLASLPGPHQRGDRGQSPPTQRSTHGLDRHGDTLLGQGIRSVVDSFDGDHCHNGSRIT